MAEKLGCIDTAALAFAALGPHMVAGGEPHRGFRRLGVPHAGLEGSQPQGERLLGRTHYLQEKYSTQIAALGIREVHQRPSAEPRSVLCMDGGLISPTLSAVRIAGPVGLVAESESHLPELVRNGEIIIGGVYNHAECGAAGLQGDALKTSKGPDAVGELLAKRLARKLSNASQTQTEVPYVGMLPLARRPSGKHIEQVVTVDGRRNGMDPSRIKGFPPAFVISEGVMGEDAAREYARIAINIAFGAHGIPELLSHDNPLHLVGIAENHADVERLQNLLDILRREREAEADRIVTSVLVANS